MGIEGQAKAVGTSAGIFWFDERRPDMPIWRRDVTDHIMSIAWTKDSLIWVGQAMVGRLPFAIQRL